LLFPRHHKVTIPKPHQFLLLKKVHHLLIQMEATLLPLNKKLNHEEAPLVLDRIERKGYAG
jgi:hypothetical protein